MSEKLNITCVDEYNIQGNATQETTGEVVHFRLTSGNSWNDMGQYMLWDGSFDPVVTDLHDPFLSASHNNFLTEINRPN